MTDLPPEADDKSPTTIGLQVTPRHDNISVNTIDHSSSARWRILSAERAEAGIELLSRWAGPAALITAVAGIAWWIFD
ncbi:hypothetical protein [Sphingobium vermicomposti]|uniref:Uncharacterized protein n=1 Tax=Sphingobium vermicomposti TaxID=529005 RepID=A0A846MGQ0_9SPHN|nr:hypothetical protein [Sphingobium vermicomposti]NIJ16216.1 hypothetical protein [Sphingobium vermicomposti]